jgi:hypothetical protein
MKTIIVEVRSPVRVHASPQEIADASRRCCPRGRNSPSASVPSRPYFHGGEEFYLQDGALIAHSAGHTRSRPG